jgi:hypothetical protein
MVLKKLNLVNKLKIKIKSITKSKVIVSKIETITLNNSKYMKYFLIFFSIISFAQNNKFIPVDDETLEFIEDVKYSLYLNKKEIYSNQTSKDTVTFITNNIIYDSISFYKLNYKEFGFLKDSLKETVLLTKKIYELNEVVVIGNTKNDLFIGEKSRFIKRRYNILSENIDNGIIFRENELKDVLISKLIFYIDKVKHKTTYKIKFFEADEIGNPLTSQTLQLGNLFFESPTLTLEQGTKDKIEVDLESYSIDFYNKNIFVTIVLQNYFDENNNIIKPETSNRTKLKHQISKKTNYYSKMADYYTDELTIDLHNINQNINYEFAVKFFKKPHKSILVAPAILFSAKKKN